MMQGISNDASVENETLHARYYRDACHYWISDLVFWVLYWEADSCSNTNKIPLNDMDCDDHVAWDTLVSNDRFRTRSGYSFYSFECLTLEMVKRLLRL
jgi:hypothetical protein